jgi:hypothetical protein
MLIAFLKLAAVIVGTLVAIPVGLVVADSSIRSHFVTSERERWVAPDGSATVVIYGAFSIVEMFRPRFPGQGSDGPGIVRVFDRRGAKIHEHAVDFLGSLTPISYSGGHCVLLDYEICWPDRLEDHVPPG